MINRGSIAGVKQALLKKGQKGVSTVLYEGEMLPWAQIHGSCISVVLLSVRSSQKVSGRALTANH